MARTLWEYLTQPVDGGYKPDASYADVTLHNATIVPRFIARTGKSVYDSFKRMATPLQFGEDPYLRREQNIEDAFNVAGAAMVGGMPGVPKGNNPGTLGMAFRRPKDVVYTTKGEFNPTSSTLKEDFGDNYDLYNLISRYHNKKWGTVDDPVIQHIDKGFIVPNIPGLDTKQLNDTLFMARDFERNGQLSNVLKMSKVDGQTGQAAKTDIGKYVELLRDGQEMFQNTGISNADHVSFSRGLPQKTKDYALSNDVHMFSKPSIIDLALSSGQLPYKIEGNLNRMSLADMLMQASEKEAALAKAPIEKLHEFDDGHYWTQLKTQAQREAESEAMGNSTRMPIHDNKDLYSLRDKNGKSILTASRYPGDSFFDEVKTRFNKEDSLENLWAGKPSEHERFITALQQSLQMDIAPWKNNGKNK